MSDDAVCDKETEIMFKVIKMTVSKAQIVGMKCLRNKLIKLILSKSRYLISSKLRNGFFFTRAVRKSLVQV